MATVKKRGNVYRIQVSLGTDSNGKRIRYSETYTPKAKTPKAIEKEIAQRCALLDAQAKNGELCYSGFQPSDTIVFSEFIERWKTEWAKDNLTLSQQEQYYDCMMLHVVPYIGKMKLVKIQKKDCAAIVSDLKEKEYAPKTIRRIITALRSVLEYAIDLEIISANPCERLKLPRLQKDDEIHCFDVEQAERFLNALEMKYPTKHGGRKRKDSNGNEYSVKEYVTYREIPLQFKVYYHLAIKGGFRRGEMIALTWQDVDFNRRIVSINKASATTKAEGQIIKDTKTASGKREVYLPQDCFDLLEEWFYTQKEYSRTTAWKGKPTRKIMENNVFIQNDGTPMNLSTPRQKFSKIIKMYNALIEEQAENITDEEAKEKKLSERLPEITLHDLRHTFATILISEGADIVTVSKLMGHSSPSVTMDVYSHLLVKTAKEASDIFERIFAPKNTDSTAVQYVN